MQGGSQGFWTQKLTCGECSPLLPPQLNFVLVECQFYVKKSFPWILTSIVLDVVSSLVITLSLAPSVGHGGPQDHPPENPHPGPASWIPPCPLNQPEEGVGTKTCSPHPPSIHQPGHVWKTPPSLHTTKCQAIDCNTQFQTSRGSGRPLINIFHNRPLPYDKCTSGEEEQINLSTRWQAATRKKMTQFFREKRMGPIF